MPSRSTHLIALLCTWFGKLLNPTQLANFFLITGACAWVWDWDWIGFIPP
jgi:hypothetical protein